MRIVLHVLGMFVLGAASLLCVGWLYHVRTAPVSSGPSADERAVGTAGSDRRLGADPTTETAEAVAGLDDTLQAFAASIDASRRREAARALDRARRIVDVLRGGASGDPRVLEMARAVDDIAHAFQNGDAEDARQRARAARAVASHLGSIQIPTPPSLAPYVGATVLRPTGEMNGTIVAVAGDSVTIERGGMRDLMGFIDLGPGTRTSVPVNALLFGKARSIGKTLVIGPR